MQRPSKDRTVWRILCHLTASVSLLLLPAREVVFGQSLYTNPRVLLDATPDVSIAGVGDLMLSSWAIPILHAKGVDYPFRQTQQLLKSADAAIANLEAPFTESGEAFDKKYTFKVPPAFARGLLPAGIPVVNLANNHIMDFGETGLRATLQTLDRFGIKHTGAGMNKAAAHAPMVVTVRGKRVAFFGYSMTFPTEFYATDDSAGTAYPEPELMAANIAAYDKTVDYVVVSFHWGAEKRDTPKDYQIYFAHLAVDSGADLVLGHHPHVLQGLELYKNRLIAYSLGNYAFASYSKRAVDSIVLKVYLNDEGMRLGFVVPINVNNIEVEFQPMPLRDSRRTAVIRRLQELSRPLNGGRDIIEDTGFILGAWADFMRDMLLEAAVRAYFQIRDVRTLNAGVGEYGAKSTRSGDHPAKVVEESKTF